MKKLVSIGLFGLLLYHTLAYVLVAVGAWWQAEHDLSKELLVYRSVDSIVEFQVPMGDTRKAVALTRTTSEGFTYKGHYYDVVSMEVRGDRLHIAALETENRSFWSSDLLSFLNDHVSGTSNSRQKASQLLKLLLKEYSPVPRVRFNFLLPHWHDVIRIPDVVFVFASRALPIHSPPPES
ncbi:MULTISPECIES: hypothetical protein [Spirosoma]|uniref:Uncharacterized protein n=1 Tax=Spirosoma sordidisoli TaxID=2502893 RepID=A0A4V1RWX7_9BACT|nr:MULTISPECIES: hypothetical protein [Spirosoma]RYC71808.1 hypothetical protein EQG79_06680 [Spirosoma sordidisoli]